MSKMLKKYKIGVGLSITLVLLVALLLSFVDVKAEPIFLSKQVYHSLAHTLGLIIFPFS